MRIFKYGLYDYYLLERYIFLDDREFVTVYYRVILFTAFCLQALFVFPIKLLIDRNATILRITTAETHMLPAPIMLSTQVQIIFVTFSIVLVKAKIYSHCELANELLAVHEIPKKQLATWVCIAEHESNMNTSAMNRGSGDHGLFQISELFWCSPPGYACSVSCTDLRNDDIEDDVICARRIYREHKRLSGDGFNAWVVYKLYCNNGNVGRYIEECFDGGKSKVEEASTTTERVIISSSKNLLDRTEERSTIASSTSIDKTSTVIKKEIIRSTTDGLKMLSTLREASSTSTKRMILSMQTARASDQEEPAASKLSKN